VVNKNTAVPVRSSDRQENPPQQQQQQQQPSDSTTTAMASTEAGSAHAQPAKQTIDPYNVKLIRLHAALISPPQV